MSDAQWAARQGDALAHSSIAADIFGGALEVLATVAAGAAVSTAIAAAAGITVATGGLAGCVLAAAVGSALTIGMQLTGADEKLSTFCHDLAGDLFPPTVCAHISTGSPDVFINGLPAARAAGSISQSPVELPEDEAPEGTFLDIAKGFFSELWRPTVATPDPRAVPESHDQIICDKHPGMPGQYLAEGSCTVFINGRPAVRSGDRSTCGAVVVSSGSISPNVRIGGGKAVVRTIRSGKTPGVGLAVSALMMLRGGLVKFVSNLPCLLLGGASAYVVGAVGSALARAVSGSPNPVHAATGAKVLGGDEDLDFALPGVLPITWQRFYSSRDERQEGLFGTGWSVPFEVCVRIERSPAGGERLIYVDEQARTIDMGLIPPGGAVFSAGEGLTVKRHDDGRVLIESEEGRYRLFEPTLIDASDLRLSQLGDRNDNRIHLIYDADGRLCRLHDTLDVVRVTLVYSTRWPGRIERIERMFDDDTAETLARYAYDASGQLAEVYDALGKRQRQFAYDDQQRMVEHRLPTGLRCFYEWALVDEREWRVARHWTDDGEEYRFDYDLIAGSTSVADGLGRHSVRRWNTQHQITEYTDNIGLTWQFSWNDERQLLGATDPNGGAWAFTYDEAGNLSSTEDPLGRIESTLWLEHWSLPKVEADAAGNHWQYRYDARGNRTHEVDPLGHVTRYRFDERGRVIEVIDAAEKSKTLSWNTHGRLTEYTDCSGYSTWFAYDQRGFLRRTDAAAEHVLYSHDALGRLIEREGPEKRVERYLHDDSGLLVGFVNAAEEITRYRFDLRGRLWQRTDPHNRTVESRYDPYGRLKTLTNENGESYRFGWDAADRLSVQQNLDGSQWRYQYDALGNLIYADQVASDDAIVHRFERDAVGRLIAKVTDDGRTVYDYDLIDNLIGVTFTGQDGEQQTVRFAYDALSQLISETTSSGTINHRYDELGNLTQTQLPDGRWLNRLYYGSGHLHQINLDGQVISDFERDRLHREVLRTQGQHETRIKYDRQGRVSERLRVASGASGELPIYSIKKYQYDVTDNLITRIHHLPQGELRTQLGYDSSGRILAAQTTMHGLAERYDYDPAGNLLSRMPRADRQIVHNQLQSYQDKHYRYDSLGRAIEKRTNPHAPQRFAYDAESRLIEVHNPDDHVVRMRYDPLGRRVSKTLYHPDAHILFETQFIWDGLRLLHEQQGRFPTLYLYADHGYEPLARIDGEGEHQRIRYYHNDLNGLPEQVTEADGSVIWHARYQVWGNTDGEHRERYFVELQNLRFQGQYLDRETGLHYNTFRYYDPDIGRFTTPDPIGLAGGLNLYQYAPNPIGWVDPWGWSCAPNKKTSYQGTSRRDAFRQARLDAGIPASQSPYSVGKEKLMDGYGGYVYKNGRIVYTREYYFLDVKGARLIIQDHSYGHLKAVPQRGAEPHFNVRPIINPKTGSVEGTHGHYNY